MDKIQETTSKTIVLAKEKSSKAAVEAHRLAIATKVKTVALVKAPHFQTVTVSSGTGAVVLGCVGGAFGTACGAVVGTTAGALPALFTFGLSLPFGAVVGGTLGGCAGVVAGGSTGLLAGGAAGECGFRYRIEIKDGLIYVRKQATGKVEKASLMIKDTAAGIKTRVSEAHLAAAAFTLAKASAARTMAVENFTKAHAAAVATAKNRRVQVTAASAVGGTVVCAPAGGVAGGVVGGVIGLVPAIFTFGLSIPVCSAIGGGLGFCAGAVAGGLGGGSIGFGSYTYRNEIKDSAQSVQKQFGEKAQATQEKIAEAKETATKKIGDVQKQFGEKAQATQETIAEAKQTATKKFGDVQKQFGEKAQATQEKIAEAKQVAKKKIGETVAYGRMAATGGTVSA